MRRGVLAIIVVIALLIVGYFLMKVSVQNTIIGKEEAVSAQWADVQSAYQRRSDLIPNLVNTVKGAADFEKSTLTQVIEARSKATSVNVDPANLSPDQIHKFEEAQNQLSGALSRLLVTVERYPDLKTSKNFLALQSQLEGTENRINVERNRFNDQVRSYNAYIRKFPGNLFAGNVGAQPKGYFEAQPGSDKAPTVNF